MENPYNYIQKGMRTALLAVAIYSGALIGSQAITVITAPRITTQSQLESKLAEERKKLNKKIDENTIIHAILSTNDDEISHAEKLGENEYKIVLSPGMGSNESTLRHELYHIADGHCYHKEKIRKGFRGSVLEYFFWHEPQATIYEITGLKP